MTIADISRVKQLRDQGQTLQQIGYELAIAKEWARQLLIKHYGAADTAGAINRSQLAKLLGCSADPLKRLEREGVVSPEHIGKFYWYDESAALKAAEALRELRKS